LNLAALALQQQETSNAIGYYQRVLSVEPTQPIATYMLAALLRGVTPKKAPEAYVSALFDQYATHFDRHLNGALQYQTPQHLRHLYDRVTKALPIKRLLDLGCGTGLSGAAFADIASDMVGVDLSEAMLAKAQDKQLYQALCRQDIVAYLQQPGESFDAMIAADVLVYLGDLSDFFEQAALRLNDQAWLLCSIEIATTEVAFELTPNGRFQHALSYIRDSARTSGLQFVRHEKVTLRLQEGQAVEGYIIALQKRCVS
jgi:predicted TPR repeat methyltransferase